MIFQMCIVIIYLLRAHFYIILGDVSGGFYGKKFKRDIFNYKNVKIYYSRFTVIFFTVNKKEK